MSSAKFMKKFFIIDSITISLLVTYYHHLNLVSDLVQLRTSRLTVVSDGRDDSAR